MNQLNTIYRKRWLINRKELEDKKLRVFPLNEGTKIPKHDPIGILIKLLGFILKLTGLFHLGKKNTEKITLTENKVKSPKLSMNKITLLHLSDLHIGEGPVDIERIIQAIKECSSYHFAVITGDLFSKLPNSEDEFILNKLLKSLNPVIDTLCVLGNHDSYKIVPRLEKLGVKVLTNQIVYYPKSEKLPYELEVIGTDDPHYFFQKDALRILQEGNPDRYRISLVHSPELYDAAEKYNIDLYLCGHTHGGQIALPGGFAPLKRVYRGKKYYKGSWIYKNLSGYTSSGVGTSGIPVRFFTTAEITLHCLSGPKG